MKKITAIILAAILIMSMLPTVFAEGEDTDYTYYFHTDSFDVDSKTYDLEDNDLSGWTLKDGYSDWCFVNVSSRTSCNVRSGFLNWVFKSPATGPVYTQEGTSSEDLTGAMALEIAVPESGTYSFKMKIRTSTTPKNIELYLVPKAEFIALAGGDCYYDRVGENEIDEKENFRKAVATLSSNNRIGCLANDKYTSSNWTYVDIPLDKMTELSKGDYIFVMVPNGESSTGAGSETVCIRELVLTKKFINKAVDIDNQITTETTFQYAPTPVRDPNVSKGYFDANLRYDSYLSANYAGQGTYIAFPVVVGNIGRYELQMKAYNNEETSAAPAIYFVHEDDLMDGNEAQGRNYGSTKAHYVGAYKDDLVTPVGYYNFATASTVEYSAVKDASGNAAKLNLVKTGTYYVVICPEQYSRTLNAKVRNTSDNNAVVDTIENGYINADGSLKDANAQKNPAGDTKPSIYQQDISLAGIKLKALDKTAEEIEIETSETEKLEIINEDGGTVNATGTASTNTTVNAFAAYIGGSEIDGDVIKATTAEIGADCTVTAGEVTGYKFLYWAKGFDTSRKILSHNAEYTFKPKTGTNNIIAVYESTSAEPRKKAEFYNGNAQLLESYTGEFKVPALPTMAGFGNAIHWALNDSEETFKGGENLTADSELLFVAQYNDAPDVKITVENGEGSGTYAYGEEVTVSATKRENKTGANVFNYWLKNDEIVGFGTTYTFNAWEDVTVTAVYKEYQPIAKNLTKIILRESANNNIMAEFIGLSDAVEKGIIFGGSTLETASYRTAMTGDGNQFAVENNIGLDATGYAILANGDVVYDK